MGGGVACSSSGAPGSDDVGGPDFFVVVRCVGGKTVTSISSDETARSLGESCRSSSGFRKEGESGDVINSRFPHSSWDHSLLVVQLRVCGEGIIDSEREIRAAE